MATITDNLNGSLTMVLTPDEQDTWAGLPMGQLENYLTLWMQDRGKSVLSDQLAKMTSEEKAIVMPIVRNAGKLA